jgi:hypothetical protein
MENKKIICMNTKLAKIIYEMEATINSHWKTRSGIYVPAQTFSVN